MSKAALENLVKIGKLNYSPTCPLSVRIPET